MSKYNRSIVEQFLIQHGVSDIILIEKPETIYDIVVLRAIDLKNSGIACFELGVKSINMVLDSIGHVKLSGLTREYLTGRLEAAGLKKRSIKRFRAHFFFWAQLHGWLSDDYEPTQRDATNLLAFLEEYEKDAAEVATLNEAACILVNDTKHKSKWHADLSDGYVLKMLKQIGTLPLADITHETILEASCLCVGTVNTAKLFKTYFTAAFIRPSIERGWLPEWHFEHNLHQLAFKQKNTLDSIPVVKRTIGWYACKLYVDDHSNAREKMSVPGTRSVFYNKLIPLWDKPCIELTREDIAYLQQKPRAPYAIDVVYEANKDGLVDSSLFKKTVKSSYADDIWFYKGTKKIDFSNIKEPSFKDAAKKFMQHRLHTTQRENYSTDLLKLQKYFFHFLSANGISQLRGFTSSVKRRMYRHFGTLIEAGEISANVANNAVSEIRIFYKFLQSISFPDINRTLVWRDGEYLAKEKLSIRYQVCPDWQLKDLIKAIGRDKDRLIAGFIAIQMLTGRRFGEVLALEIDCIVHVGPIAYMRYYSNKHGAWEEVPLESFEVAASSSLFTKSLKEIVVQFVSEVMIETSKYRPLVAKFDQKKLFIRELSKANNSGLKYIPHSGPSIRQRIVSFMRRNRLTFSYPGHAFRHTIATHLIRNGVDINYVARVLMDTPETVQKYYEKELSMLETLKLGRKQLVEPIPDAKRLIDRDHDPIILNKNKMEKTDVWMAVDGGYCSAGADETITCPNYMKIYGEYGCMGCSHFGVSPENKKYWLTGLDAATQNARNLRNTPLENRAWKTVQRVEKTLSAIKAEECI